MDRHFKYKLSKKLHIFNFGIMIDLRKQQGITFKVLQKIFHTIKNSKTKIFT